MSEELESAQKEQKMEVSSNPKITGPTENHRLWIYAWMKFQFQKFNFH
jgi:hypothetical protein